MVTNSLKILCWLIGHLLETEESRGKWSESREGGIRNQRAECQMTSQRAAIGLAVPRQMDFKTRRQSLFCCMLVTCTTVLIYTLVLNSFPDSEFEQFSSYVSVHYNCFKYHFFSIFLLNYIFVLVLSFTDWFYHNSYLCIYGQFSPQNICIKCHFKVEQLLSQLGTQTETHAARPLHNLTDESYLYLAAANALCFRVKCIKTFPPFAHERYCEATRAQASFHDGSCSLSLLRAPHVP